MTQKPLGANKIKRHKQDSLSWPMFPIGEGRGES
jgi:hypothetical protein